LRSLGELGYEAPDLEAIRHALRAPDGLVLVVGPAGSGRRTSLYSMLDELDPARNRVHTIESSLLRPVPRWQQLHTSNGRYPRNWRRWERAFGRILFGGADAILVEQIATPGVAQLAIQAAQTGHLVLSTMALGRACSVIAELRRLQVTTAQVTDALTLVIGQRLLRRLCTECARPEDREAVRRALASALNTWLGGYVVRARRPAPSGCARCGYGGYDGRVLAYELVDIDARARGLIASTVDPVELERALLADGASIWDRGLKRVAEGSTSFDALQAAVRQPR
jgi:type II secretory ATPase GspE/PulE/Tfp pilus assembly ATPase PilB-like protein